MALTHTPKGLLKALKQNGAHMLDNALFSDHPGDKYLCKVLAYWDRGQDREFITWVYNSQSGGLFFGHYFDNYEDANIKFLAR